MSWAALEGVVGGGILQIFGEQLSLRPRNGGPVRMLQGRIVKRSTDAVIDGPELMQIQAVEVEHMDSLVKGDLLKTGSGVVWRVDGEPVVRGGTGYKKTQTLKEATLAQFG